MGDRGSSHVSPTVQALLAALAELSALLRRHGETHWASWVDRDVARLRNGDLGGVTDLLAAYGGMGSFNDLVLHPVNGHRIDTAEIVPANERLSDLRSQAWTLARRLAREPRPDACPDGPSGATD